MIKPQYISKISVTMTTVVTRPQQEVESDFLLRCKCAAAALTASLLIYIVCRSRFTVRLQESVLQCIMVPGVQSSAVTGSAVWPHVASFSRSLVAQKSRS